MGNFLSPKFGQFRGMHRVILLTGGNLGDRLSRLSEARTLITETIGHIDLSSGIYETAAWGNTGQPAFLNQVLLVETSLSPEDLLKAVLSIELAMGRVRSEKWGPREIDIDILFYGEEIIHMPHLQIPHPEIPNRRFVLEPLAEIAPALVHPVLKVNMETLLRNTSDLLEVKRL